MTKRHLKDKIGIYVGAFLSQFSMLLVLLLIVRNASVEDIALLAIIDGVLLFLPFFLTMMSERSSVIAFYEQGAENGAAYFASSCVLAVIVASLLLIVVSIGQFFDFFGETVYLKYTLFIIAAASGTALLNIQIQRFLVLEKYQRLTVLQIKRGVLLIIIALLLSWLHFEPASIYLFSIMSASMLAISVNLKEIFMGWQTSHFKQHLKFILKMCPVALVVVFLGYLLTNTGRWILEYNDKDKDLALLLIYTKNVLLILAVMTPFATFLKPKILMSYKTSRVYLPIYWTQMLSFSFFVAVGSISVLGLLLVLWGVNGISPDYFVFSISVVGAIAIWMMTSVVELYFESSHLLQKKLIIYGVPILSFTGFLLFKGNSLSYVGIMVVISLIQYSIFTLGLITAFGWNYALRPLFILTSVLCSIVLIGYFFNYMATKYSTSYYFLIVTIMITFFCGLVSAYYLFRKSNLGEAA